MPLLPEIIAAVAEKEGLENSPFLSDKASGIYNSAYGIGNCLAPIIGGAITASYKIEGQKKNTLGFQMCCDIMAFSSFAFCLIYLCFAILPNLGKGKAGNGRENKLIEDLAQTSADDRNNLTIEFENNRSNLK